MAKQYWQDYLQVLFGLWVAVSPWVLAPVDAPVTWNFVIVGSVLVVLAASEISSFQRWKLWLKAALGAWLLLSPRIAEFMDTHVMAVNALICGLAIVALAAWAIGDAHEILPRFVHPVGDLRNGLESLSLPDESEHMAGMPRRRAYMGPDIVHPGGGTQSPGQISHE